MLVADLKGSSMKPINQDGNEVRLERHRALHNIGLKPLPSAIETTLAEALEHLNSVLNGCKTHAEQQSADVAARDFLALHL